MKGSKSKKKSRVIPSHESGLRRVISDMQGLPYQPLHTLEEAQSFIDGAVILEGDDGGQIYVVCPASMVKCSIKRLNKLLRDLDEIAWPGNFSHMRRIYYECLPVGSGVAGGMGGAVVKDGVWIHDEFIHMKLDTAIREVIEGKRARIHNVA
jgi:hypothetical protein